MGSMHKASRDGSLARICKMAFLQGLLGGQRPMQFHRPRAVAVGMCAPITLYIADSYKNRIQCFDIDDGEPKFIRMWGCTGTEDGNFNRPQGIAVGTHYDSKTAVLEKLYEIGELRAFPPGLLSICTAYVGKECVYVTEYEGQRVQMFERDGTFVRKWGRRGKKDAEFQNPLGCAIGANGYVYVCDSGNCRIQIFSANGRFITKTEIIANPQGIHIDDTDQLVYVTSKFTPSILFFKMDTIKNELVATHSHRWDKCTHVFHGLHGIVTLGRQSEWMAVAHWAEHCLLLFNQKGTFVVIEKFGTPDDRIRLKEPTGLAKGPDGTLYVADAGNNRIVVISPIQRLY